MTREATEANTVRCRCGTSLKVPPTAAHRKGKCPKCGLVFVLPTAPCAGPAVAGPAMPRSLDTLCGEFARQERSAPTGGVKPTIDSHGEASVTHSSRKPRTNDQSHGATKSLGQFRLPTKERVNRHSNTGLPRAHSLLSMIRPGIVRKVLMVASVCAAVLVLRLSILHPPRKPYVHDLSTLITPEKGTGRHCEPGTWREPLAASRWSGCIVDTLHYKITLSPEEIPAGYRANARFAGHHQTTVPTAKSDGLYSWSRGHGNAVIEVHAKPSIDWVQLAIECGAVLLCTAAAMIGITKLSLLSRRRLRA